MGCVVSESVLVVVELLWNWSNSVNERRQNLPARSIIHNRIEVRRGHFVPDFVPFRIKFRRLLIVAEGSLECDYLWGTGVLIRGDM